MTDCIIRAASSTQGHMSGRRALKYHLRLDQFTMSSQQLSAADLWPCLSEYAAESYLAGASVATALQYQQIFHAQLVAIR